MPFCKILNTSITEQNALIGAFRMLIIPKFYVRINRKAPHEKFRYERHMILS